MSATSASSGVDKQGEEFYQITLGGSADGATPRSARSSAPASGRACADAVERIVEAYLELRANDDEPFIEAYRRAGEQPFKEALYAAA